MKTAIEMLSDVKAYIAELEAENARLCKCLKEAIAEFCHECHDKRIENCREKCFVANWRDVVENGEGENR